MSIQLDVTGPGSNKLAFESALNIADNTKSGIEFGLWRSGKDILSEFNKQVLSKNKSGRIYIRKDRLGRRRKHTASAVGESPANRTGFYRKGADSNVSPNQLVFGNSVEYSEFLELGTSRMKARPGLKNAIVASERNIMRNLADNIERRL